MKITNIGGATAILEHNGKRMLCDPWMDEGILHGSWHHYPPLKMGLEDLGRIDFIYISHIHEDHCSPKSVNALNRDAEVIIMDRESRVPNFISKFLRYNRFDFAKVHLIKPNTPTKIDDDMTVEMLEANPANEYSYLVDSAMMLDWGGHVVYNANDCAPHALSTERIKKNYPKVDLAMIPYSGGSGYPGCYTNLSESEKLKEKKRILEFRYEVFVEAVRALDPTWVMPFADQYVIGGSRSHLNRFSPHPPSPGGTRAPLTKAGMVDKLLLLNSAQSFDLGSGMLTPNEPYNILTESDRESFIEEKLQNWRYDHEKVEFRAVVPVDRLLKHARERLWVAQQRRDEFPESNLYFNVTSTRQTFRIDLMKEGVTRVAEGEDLVEPFVKISADHTLFAMMLINHVSWNMADGALFLDYERVPNDYDPRVYALLNFLTV